MTFESGITGVVDDEVRSRLLRQARERGWNTTPVRRGHVVTLPSGAMVAVLREAP
ncbi:hypothetical protein [Streptomyces sp. NRRL S-378]|uniref:hypothetical protein n=1 Tax=Streptomyces sp. NRRL S-378 TaxID=1463904 RepID=UPI00131D4B2A|nr:hypothetical protein [Streptomyces sp. NRRL S-378]